MLFIFPTPALIRHLWQLITVVFLHRCLIHAFILELTQMHNHSILGNQLRHKKYNFLNSCLRLLIPLLLDLQSFPVQIKKIIGLGRCSPAQASNKCCSFFNDQAEVFLIMFLRWKDADLFLQI